MWLRLNPTWPQKSSSACSNATQAATLIPDCFYARRCWLTTYIHTHIYIYEDEIHIHQLAKQIWHQWSLWSALFHRWIHGLVSQYIKQNYHIFYRYRWCITYTVYDIYMVYINIEQRVSSASISLPSVQSNIWNVIPDLQHMKAKWNEIVRAKILTELQFPLTTFKYWSKIKLLFFLALCVVLKGCFLFLLLWGSIKSEFSSHNTNNAASAHLEIFYLCSFPFFFFDNPIYSQCFQAGLKVISFRGSHYF